MEDKFVFPKPSEVIIVIVLSIIFVSSSTIMLAGIFDLDLTQLEQNAILYKIFSGIGQVGLIIIPLIFIRSRNLNVQKVFRLYEIPKPVISLSIIAGMSMSILIDEMDRIVAFFNPDPKLFEHVELILKINNPTDFILVVLGTLIAIPIIEEVLFRGFLQNSFEEHRDVTNAVIYTSITWMVVHFELFWAVQIFLTGIFYGLLTWRSGSVYPAIICHFINNLFGLINVNFAESTFFSIYLMKNHVSPIFLILALVGMFYSMRSFFAYYDETDRNVSSN